MQGLTLEQEGYYYRKDGQGNDFLDYFELHQVERTAVSLEADAVGRYGETVLEKGDSPGKKDDENERPARGNAHFLQLEMAIPRERHENVREDEHNDSPETLHGNLYLGGKFNNFV